MVRRISGAQRGSRLAERMVVRPGYLVSLSTSIRGGVSYQRRDIDHAIEDNGQDRAVWETKRTIEDAAEFKRATQVRTRVRTLILAACVETPFGLIVPKDTEVGLDRAIEQARAEVDAFNATARYSRVTFRTLRGQIASSDEEAITEIRDEIVDLLEDLEDQCRAGSVDGIREVARKASEVSLMLEAESSAALALNKAVSSARDLAKRVARRVVKRGEDLAVVLAEANLQDISGARFAFMSADEEEEALSGQVEQVATRRLDATSEINDVREGTRLPDVAGARFVDMDNDSIDDAEQED